MAKPEVFNAMTLFLVDHGALHGSNVRIRNHVIMNT